MRIAVLAPAYPFRGGIAKHTGMLCRALEKRGHSFQIFSFLKQFPQFLFPGVTQFDTSEQADQIASLRVFTPWNPCSWLKTARAVKQYQPDLLVCVWWTPFTGAGYRVVCGLLKGIRKLFLLHNASSHEKMPGGRFFTRMGLKHADGYIIQSKQVESELLDIVPSSAGKWRRLTVHPCYNFQDYCSLHQSTAREILKIKESRVMLFFGLVRKYKGLMTLLQAFPQVVNHFIGDIRLIITGEFYDDPAPYLQAISQNKVEDKITIYNRFIPNEEVGRYYSAADVVVLPYESASQSGVIPAAYGFGKPVITTAVGGLPEAVEEGRTGLLCPPSNPQALAETIIRFYDLNQTVNWRENIDALKGKFSWEILAELVERFYREQGTENREQRTGNREQRTGNREQGTGNREQRTGNREQGTGNREQGTENREQ